MKDKITKHILLMPVTITGVIIFAVGLSILMSYPLMWCWNYVVPLIFGLPKITFWQMFCFNFLMTSFFKNIKLEGSKN